MDEQDEQDEKEKRADGPRQFTAAFAIAFLIAFAWILGFPWLLRGIKALVAGARHGP
jgi:hypothetical protein